MAESICSDCLYIGRLKGVGKVWQITACDAASRYALAQVSLGESRAEVGARLLQDVTAHFQ